MTKTKTIIRKDNGVKLKYKVKPNWKLDTWAKPKDRKEVLSKLEYALVRNCTEWEACAYAWISQQTLIEWKKEDPKLSERIDDRKKLYKQAIKFKSYERAMNSKNKDSTEILFKIDDDYKEKKQLEVWETSLVAIARLMQQKRLDKEKENGNTEN